MLISLSFQPRLSVETGIFDGQTGYIHDLSVTGLHCLPFKTAWMRLNLLILAFFQGLQKTGIQWNKACREEREKIAQDWQANIWPIKVSPA